DLITKMHCDANKISVVYEGYRKDYFKHLGKSMVENDLKKLKVTPPFLLFVGTIQPRKNVMRLIQAFSKLASDYPSLSLCLVGKKGWLSDDVYALPTQLGLSDRVKFLGHVKEEDLVALYNGAELLVFPSLFEGFGLPVVEAFACGLPVVTSSTSSLPEVGGDACVYVEPTSIEEIEGAIRRVLSNTMLRDELIRKGLKQAGTFSWEKAAKETLTVLERVYENTM
ncbi:MAG TPA: glycosyltransferase family 1 protein, partial [Patescibacteria group bacterium]|nr:glycosyltransferase family 1 protein [Patescibacteria group bacterium]